MQSARDILATFTLSSVPTLDVAVRGALELFAAEPPHALSLPYARPLVLGSGNAFVAAQIIFEDADARFGDETSYLRLLQHPDRFDGVVVMSASGGKHAGPMCEAALRSGLPVALITNNPAAPAASLIQREAVYTFSKNREPYTYNTSTYLGPVLGKTGEDPDAIAAYLSHDVVPRLLRNFGDYRAFSFLVPEAFQLVRPMLRTKFDELFGPHLVGRFFTPEEAKHAKTVVVSGDELFIAFGVVNEHYGIPRNRLSLPLMEGGGYASVIAATYTVVGHIQAANPPYFAQSIEAYAKTVSEIFGCTIPPIVE